MSDALTSIQLYGSPKIADDVHKFMKNVFNRKQIQKPSSQEVENLDMALQDLTKAMKADLLQQDMGKRVH